MTLQKEFSKTEKGNKLQENRITEEEIERAEMELASEQEMRFNSLTGGISEQEIARASNEIAQEKEIEEKKQSEINQRQIQTAAEFGGKGITMGHAAQVQAAAEPLTDVVFGLFQEGMTPQQADEVLKSKGVTIVDNTKKDYTERRDENLERQDTLAEEFPKTAFAAELGGNLVTSTIAGGAASGLAKGTKLAPLINPTSGLGRIGQAAAAGGAYGAAFNPSDEKGEVDTYQLAERLENAAYGAITGGLFQAGAESIKKVIPIIKSKIFKKGEKYKNLAELEAYDITGPMLKDVRKAEGLKQKNAIGRTMLDKVGVNVGDSFEDVAKKSEILKIEVGEQLGDLYKKVDSADLANVIDLKTKIPFVKASNSQLKNAAKSRALKEVLKDGGFKVKVPELTSSIIREVKKDMAGLPGRKKVLSRVKSLIQDLETGDELITLTRAKEIRTAIGEQINFFRVNDFKTVENRMVNIYGKMTEQIKNKLKQHDLITGEKTLDAFNLLNKDYSNLKTILKTATDRASRKTANSNISLINAVMGAGGVGAMGMFTDLDPASKTALAIMGAFGPAAYRKYGTAMKAKYYNNLAKMITGSPELMGKFARPLSVAAKRGLPYYVKTVNALIDENEEFENLLRKSKYNEEN